MIIFIQLYLNFTYQRNVEHKIKGYIESDISSLRHKIDYYIPSYYAYTHINLYPSYLLDE